MRYVSQGMELTVRLNAREEYKKKLTYLTEGASGDGSFDGMIAMETGEGTVGQSGEVEAAFQTEQYGCCILVDALGKEENGKSFVYVLEGSDGFFGKELVVRKTYVTVLDSNESEKIGKEKVIWRYDPIVVNQKYTMDYHLKAFEEIAENLADYTEKVVISFVDLYAKTQRNTKDLAIRTLSNEEMFHLAAEMAQIASKHNLIIESCAEQIDLQKAGVRHGSCIDKRLIEKILGCKLIGEKDKNQREECGCFESVEVGTYNTCLNGCKYCYANFSEERVRENIKCYDPKSPLLCGKVDSDDKITDRKVKSLKDNQLSLFE